MLKKIGRETTRPCRSFAPSAASYMKRCDGVKATGHYRLDGDHRQTYGEPARPAARTRRPLLSAPLDPAYLPATRDLQAPHQRLRTRGEVPEWSNGAVSKTVVPARVPWVRIPPSPPSFPSSSDAVDRPGTAVSAQQLAHDRRRREGRRVESKTTHVPSNAPTQRASHRPRHLTRNAFGGWALSAPVAKGFRATIPKWHRIRPRQPGADAGPSCPSEGGACRRRLPG